MNEMTRDELLNCYDLDRRWKHELELAEYQIYRVSPTSGYWVEVPARMCAPSHDEEDTHSYFAIVKGKPQPITVRPTGSELIPFPTGDDGETQHNYVLVVDDGTTYGMIVGDCSYREY